jgi:mycothiol synthase
MRPELVPISLTAEELSAFVETIDDEVPALSEHKMQRLGGADDAVVQAWADADTGADMPAVLSVAALHEGDRPHWAVEVAVRPDARRPELESAALAAATAGVPAPHTLWAHRPEQIVAAETLGYREIRRVVRMEGPFPEAPGDDWATIDRLAAGDDAALIAVHNRAFAGHPEASGLTRRRLDELRLAPWYDPDGVVVARRDGVLVGYCWTRLHDNGDGEVYFLAVDPSVQGHGVGEALAATAYHHLRDRGARRAMLWVDGDNDSAVALYRRLGLQPTASNVELEPG